MFYRVSILPELSLFENSVQAIYVLEPQASGQDKKVAYEASGQLATAPAH